MKVSELKAALAEKGLDTKGNKAALVERLQVASEGNEDTGKVNDDDDGVKSNKDNEILNEEKNNPEKVKVDEKSSAAEVVGEEEEDTSMEEGNNFENKEFVSKKPTGISFGLHEPTPVKPQPKELIPPSIKDNEVESENNQRTEAATFFGVEENSTDPDTGEAVVPLPPSTGYGLEGSDDDEDEGPPGTGTIKLPEQMLQGLGKDETNLKEPEDPISWRSFTAVPPSIDESNWKPNVHLQNPALFLKEEAEMAGEELVYEIEDNDVPGLSPTSLKMQLTYFEVTVKSEGDSEELAMQEAALAMLREAGPWVEDSLFDEVTNGLKANLPMCFMNWLPPLYNISHVSMVDAEGATFVGEQPGRKLYKVVAILGPIKCETVSETVQDGLECLGHHLKSFLRTRDLTKILEATIDNEEKVQFVKGSGIISVNMEGEGKTTVLPPLDIFILQKKLKDGKFPPNYSVTDEYGCSKVFVCELCNVKLIGVEKLKEHVESERHLRRLGRFFVNNQEFETFRPTSSPHIPRADVEEDPNDLDKFSVKICSACEEDGVIEIASGYCVECSDLLCESCTEAHGKTRVTKNHVINSVNPPVIHHPRKDAAEGREVKGDSEGYLIRIYRCGTIKGKGNKEAEEENVSNTQSSSRWGPPGNNGVPPLMGGPGVPGPPGMMPPGMRYPGFGPHGGPPMMGPGPMGGMRPPGPGPTGQPLDPSQEAAVPVKSGLVNDPMAGINNSGPGPGPGPQFPGQWGPNPNQWGPQGPQMPWGGPWGPRPPFPPNMICISQGNSGKPCKHFSRGQCTYGNRCIHLHLVPANQGVPPQQQAQNNAEGEESDDESEEEEEGEEGQAPVVDKRAEAKRKAFEEAMKAAKAAAAKAGDISIGSGPAAGTGGITSSQSKAPDLSMATTKLGGHMLMHAYSVGQKSKKKDPKPEEQRPGDWQCECGNYNFSWRKKCNACDRNKPFNPVEEEAKQKELERIKEDRAKRRAQQESGKIEPGDLRNLVRERSRREGDRERDRDRDRGSRGDKERDSRDRGRSSRERGRGSSRERSGFRSSGRRFEDDVGNANMVPLGPSRRFDGGSSSRDDRRSRDRSEIDKDRYRTNDDYERSRSRKDDRGDHSVKEKKEKKYKSDRQDRDKDEEHVKKHKKSHKSSKDSEYHSEKKKKRKDRSKERHKDGKEDRKRSKREADEEGEIPGDWGEWYEQGGQGSSRDNYRGKHYEHDDRRY